MNDCYGVIYCITNTIKNKCYIGQHINSTKYSLEDRMNLHKNPGSGCRYIRNSIQHHGWKNFTYSVICCCINGGQERLDELEIYFIKEYKTLCPSGYNLTDGGRGGGIPCDGTRQKMSESQKTYLEKNPDIVEKFIDRMKCFWANPDARQKQSENTTKYFANPENRKKQSEARKKYYEKNPHPGLKKVYQYSKDGKTFIKEWNSIKDAKITLGIHNISYAYRGVRPDAGGFVWKSTRV